MRDYGTTKALLRGIACGFRAKGNTHAAKTCDDAADAIEELLGEVPHWISVEERLPEFHMNDSGCVCTRNIAFRTECKTVHLGYVIRTAHNIETVDGFEQILMDRWYDQTGDMIEGVTHWMPLPEPPKGVE
jgi:hypothetical protein